MSEWKCQGELCDSVYYEQGNREFNQTVAFNKSAKNITISECFWQSNGEPVLVPQNDVTRYSCKYGHFNMSTEPTLSLEDIEWITKKGKEIFGE